MHVFTRFSLLLCLALSLPAGAVFGQEELPADAKKVLEKMEQFEAQTILEAQVKIEKKRLDVARYLEMLLETETKSGNLDGGLAIREAIKQLRAKPSADLTKVAIKEEQNSVAEEDGKDSEGVEKEDELHPVIGRWAFEDKDRSDLVREFTAGGKCVQFRNGNKEWSLDYEVVNRREVDVVFLGALKFRHTVRGNDTLKTKEPDATAEREKKKAEDE